MKDLLLIALPLAVAAIGAAGALLGVLITLIVQYWLAQRQQRDLFRLAAIDKRLQAAQKAFDLWRRLSLHLHNEEQRMSIVGECQDWWFQNCLYLREDVRNEFHSAYNLAHMVATGDANSRKELEKKIFALGKLIEESVGLPPMNVYNEKETAKLKDAQRPPGGKA